jgi:hypothetical protein
MQHEWGRRGMYIGYWWERQKEGDHWEDHGVGGWTILKRIGWDDMDWVDLSQDRNQWRTLVNTVMNLRVPYNAVKFFCNCRFGFSSRRGQLRK